MKKVLFILLCTITCCCKKSTSEKSDSTDWANVGPGDIYKVDSLKRAKDSTEYAKLFVAQKPEDSFNQNKPQYTKYRNTIDEADYQHLERIDNLLRKRGLNICKFNSALEDIASEAMRRSKEKYPDYIVGQVELNNELQARGKRKLLQKHNITQNDAVLVTLLFQQYSNFCD